MGHGHREAGQGKAEAVEDLRLDDVEPEVAERVGLEGDVQRRVAHRAVGGVVEPWRQRAPQHRVADDPEDPLHRRQIGQAVVAHQLGRGELPGGAGGVGRGGGEDDPRPDPRGEQAAPGGATPAGEGEQVGAAQGGGGEQRRDAVAGTGALDDHLVEAGRHRVQAGEALLELHRVGRRAVPGHHPPLGRHGGQHLGDEVALGLEVDVVVARRGGTQPLAAALLAAVEAAALGTAAQGVEQPPGEVLAQRPRVDLAGGVGAHLEHLGVAPGGGEKGRPSAGLGGQRRQGGDDGGSGRLCGQNENSFRGPGRSVLPTASSVPGRAAGTVSRLGHAVVVRTPAPGPGGDRGGTGGGGAHRRSR